MTTDDPTRPEDTADHERTGGAWIGQHPDANTAEIEARLDPGAERVAVTSNESGESPPDEGWPHGHREAGKDR